MKALVTIVLVAAAAFVAGRLSAVAPPPLAPASLPVCPPAVVCPTPVTKVVRKPAPAPASRPVSVAPVFTPDSASIAAALRGCVGEQRAYAGTTLVLRLVTDASGKVTLVDLQGADFLSDPERRCVKARARTWNVASAAEEILIHVSL